MTGRRGLPTDLRTSARLSRIRRVDTGAELLVRSALSKAGLRARGRGAGLPGSPDIANRSERWVVFVNGCFWHAHPGCKRATTPKRNRTFWKGKFRANRRRDLRVARTLRRNGWSVLTIWECRTLETDMLEAEVRRVRGYLAGKRDW